MPDIAKPPCDEAAILAAPAGAAPDRQGRWVLAATILGSSMAFIDGTVVNVALPALQSALHATISQVQWVVESYALFLAALLLTGGSLGDLYSRRKVFVLGVVLFSAASAWCGLAPSITQLIVARSVQGVGGALLVPGSLALLSASFSSERRGWAIGIWSGFTSIIAAIGPVLGGWFVEHASWRWVFFINVPIGLAVAAITTWRVPECGARSGRRNIDWLGSLLATVGLGGIVYGLLESVPLAGAIGVAAILAFLFVEVRSPAPMFSLALFRSRTFAGANLLTLLLYFALNGVFFFLPLNLIQVQGYTATAAGAALLPFILLVFLLSGWAGGLTHRYGAKRPLIIGSIISAVGLALFARPGIGGSYWSTFFAPVLILGLGMAVSIAPLTTTVMTAVDQSHAGMASGINNAVSRLAGLLAVAALGLVLTTRFNRTLNQRLDAFHVAAPIREQVDRQRPELAAIATDDENAREAVKQSFVAGFRSVVWIAVILAVGSSIIAAAMVGDRQS